MLNYNGKDWLNKFLPLLLDRSLGVRLVVVDNASSDGSVSFVREHFPQISVISFEENYGFARGYNEACKRIKADTYGFINNDIEPSEGWLSSLLEILEHRSDIAVIQPKICDYKNRLFFEYAGGAGGYLDALGYAYCRGRVFSTLEKDAGQYSFTDDLHWASGSCFFIRRSVFEEVGGFDTTFFMHQEEIDLCWRLRSRGYKIACDTHSRVFHVGGGTLSYDSYRKVYYNFRNSLWMMAKNIPLSRLVPILFVRLVLDGISGVLFLKRGQFRSVGAIIAAHYDFFLRLPKCLCYRHRDRTHQYSVRSVVWAYFIQRKRTFGEIHD